MSFSSPMQLEAFEKVYLMLSKQLKVSNSPQAEQIIRAEFIQRYHDQYDNTEAMFDELLNQHKTAQKYGVAVAHRLPPQLQFDEFLEYVQVLKDKSIIDNDEHPSLDLDIPDTLLVFEEQFNGRNFSQDHRVALQSCKLAYDQYLMELKEKAEKEEAQKKANSWGHKLGNILDILVSLGKAYRGVSDEPSQEEFLADEGYHKDTVIKGNNSSGESWEKEVWRKKQ